MPGGRLERILVKRARRGPMDDTSEAQLVAGRGMRGNADQGGRRQLTILGREGWDALAREIGQPLDAAERRANLVVSGLNLAHSRGRILLVGEVRLRINGETRPCERMDDVAPGLQAAMRRGWAGGAYGEVLDSGVIRVGDEVRWESGGRDVPMEQTGSDGSITS
ncbi:MAG: MOSC domain-containing protein [Vicinamibacterales bacterium]